MTDIKICGLTTPEALNAAQKAGATYAGFVFYPKSPRNIAPDRAKTLTRLTPLKAVGLFVDPDDDMLTRILAQAPLDMIQLHGSETPNRTAEIRAKFNLPVMKALRIADKSDLASAKSYDQVADWLLFDAKVTGEVGGTGQAFDWNILQDFESVKPWMLAGGLTPENVAEAIQKCKPDAVDVSSGVEAEKGVKDACKIAAFCEIVRTCKTA